LKGKGGGDNQVKSGKRLGKEKDKEFGDKKPVNRMNIMRRSKKWGRFSEEYFGDRSERIKEEKRFC
jgi:hypothetical protein